jgi:hypothetical protein
MTRDEHRAKIKALTRQYAIRCHITRRTEVLVEATSEEHAMKKFNAMDWIDEHPCGEIIDFTHSGSPKVNA